MTSNVREQIRFLIKLNKSRNGEINNHLHLGSFQRKAELINVTDEEQKRIRTREYQLSKNYAKKKPMKLHVLSYVKIVQNDKNYLIVIKKQFQLEFFELIYKILSLSWKIYQY